MAYSDLESWAKCLGGDVRGQQILCPGPWHSSRDRSLSIRFNAGAPDGFVVYSFAGDDYRICKDHVIERLGLRHRAHQRKPVLKPLRRTEANNRTELALFLWKKRRPVEDSPAETYMRQVRRYSGPIPPTLAYLPPSRRDHHPALIAAYAIPEEKEPGCIAVADSMVRGVQLTLLKPDGSGKADVSNSKLTIARCMGTPIVLAPMDDLLGLAIVEGIEDGLSVHLATGLGVWAAGGAPRLPALANSVPAFCNCVTIVIDRDQAGRMKSRELALSLREQGLHVESVEL
jgi:hypothetical protein